MKEALEAVVVAAQELMAAPDGAWEDGLSSAQWYRRALHRRSALQACYRRLDDALCAVRNAESTATENVEAARGAVLEDAAIGDIQ
ncbi:hypothetical protein WMF38_57040 [Sorangium sp. So ce118]